MLLPKLNGGTPCHGPLADVLRPGVRADALARGMLAGVPHPELRVRANLLGVLAEGPVFASFGPMRWSVGFGLVYCSLAPVSMHSCSISMSPELSRNSWNLFGV